MRFVVLAIVTLIAACAAQRIDTSGVLTFRSPQLAHAYDFRYGRSYRVHSENHTGVVLRQCSDERFHCVAGVHVLIAPRRCADAEMRLPWSTVDGAHAEYRFAVGDRLYFENWHVRADVQPTGAEGFVYQRRRGIVGTWYSPTAAGSDPPASLMNSIVRDTLQIEGRDGFFRCAR